MRHRRGESFISNPLLIYMEPYASSTAELVTELLEYQPTEQRLTRLESTVMYAGIIVDTKLYITNRIENIRCSELFTCTWCRYDFNATFLKR